jgi:enolase
MKIAKIAGREIYDARGWPTLECELTLEDGSYVTASVPSGLSTSKQEAYELRDGGSRMSGKGVAKAIEIIDSVIAPLVVGQEPNLVSIDLALIDIDGTPDKTKLGGNTMLATSIATLRAQAAVENMEVYELVGYLCEYSSVTLPFAMFNTISGGVHAPGNVRMQEMMVIPIGSQNFRGCLEAAVMLHQYLLSLLKKNFSCVGISCEGALTANFKDDAQALEYLMEAIETVQKSTSYRFLIGLDVAASQFYDRKTGKYDWYGKTLESDELIDLYERLIKQFPIFSIEDGLAEFDEAGWIAMTRKLQEKVQLIGDDLFASSPNNIANGIEQGVATGAIIKPNQVGTITEALQAIKLCREYEMTCILSHRSCETNDTIIVDLAVGASSGYIKAGGVARGEHVAKYNELLRIEDALMLSLLEQ